MSTDIILIGAVKAGKSTVAKLLSERLGLPRCSLDSYRGYYKEAGFDEVYADRIIARQGFGGLYRYRKPFDLLVMERVLAEHRECVFDFGACHSAYEDDAMLARAKQVLKPYRNVVLLLPSRDLNESARILRERVRPPKLDGFDLCAHFVAHRANFELAKFIVYTEGQTPSMTCDEILLLTGSPNWHENGGQDDHALQNPLPR